jgi:polysaccharide biosynthesis/export protein
MDRKLRWNLAFLALGLGFLAVGCSSVVPLAPMPATGSYLIRPGDEIEFVLYQERAGEQQQPIRLVVEPDGTIMVPYAGSLQAAGHTAPELLATIREQMKKLFTAPATPHISVNVYPLRVVQVLGFVRSPGQFPLLHGMRATDALALAGGLVLPYASPDSSRLLRRAGSDETTYDIFYHEILRGGITRTNYILEPGDVIYVPPTTLRKVSFFIEDLLSPLHALFSPVLAPVTVVSTATGI